MSFNKENEKLFNADQKEGGFDWENSVENMEKHADGQKSYIMFNCDSNTPVVVLEEQFDSAFSDEYGFSDGDRRILQYIIPGEKIELSEQWFVVCTKIDKSIGLIQSMGLKEEFSEPHPPKP